MRVIWSPRALARVEEIADYIARDRPMSAGRWVEQILAATDPLADLPNMGRIVPEIGREQVRELIEGNYRIVYRVEERAVSILTVLPGHRRLESEDFERR